MNKVKLVSNLLLRNDSSIKNPDFLAKDILETLENTSKISAKILEFKNQKITAEENYKRLIKNIDSDIETVQKTCKHPLTTYYPDPSGNNDSCTECEICGAEV